MFDWITGLVEQTGYLGIALLLLAENVFPPIPSELIMPMPGFTAAPGKLSMVGVVVAGRQAPSRRRCSGITLAAGLGLSGSSAGRPNTGDG
jgi:hypothetical protein